MQSTSSLHFNQSAISSTNISLNAEKHLDCFENEGWALPIRSTFRFNIKQKKILYRYFMEGETTGKKFSPEQVHVLMRRELLVTEYVTSQQIRSLFSRWSRLKSQNKLQEPIEGIEEHTISTAQG